MGNDNDIMGLLKSRINVVAEMTELLGPSKGAVYNRHCWNKAAHGNGDKTASLSFDAQTGGWKCHAAGCGQTGDIFSLYMKTRSMTFPQVVRHLLQKYGLDHLIEKGKTHRHATEDFPWKPVDQKGREMFLRALSPTNWNQARYAFMQTRYGLDPETLIEYNIVYNPQSQRVEIPVFLEEAEKKPMRHSTALPAMANVRKHDCFRSKCQWVNHRTKDLVSAKPPEVDVMNQIFGDWEAVWSTKGKVTSIQGHGSCYLYPIGEVETLKEGEILYLMGGEFKALLLVQLGKHAVTFTGGEGSVHRRLLAMFIGKRVRVLYDPDEHGVEASKKVAKMLATIGAYTELGVWNPEIILDPGFPRKGDITDLLRIASWSTDVLDDDEFIKWVPVERDFDVSVYQSLGQIEEEQEAPIEFTDVSFDGLTTPSLLGEWVAAEAIISGSAEVPFVIPREVKYSCKEGQTNYGPNCRNCGLADAGCKATAKFGILEQIDMVGLQTYEVDKRIRSRMRIPQGCRFPTMERTNAAVEKVVLCPSIHSAKASRVDGAAHNPDFQFARRNAYLVFKTSPKWDMNAEYVLKGRVLADPRKGTFSLAVTGMEASSGGIFNWKPDAFLDEKLVDCLKYGVGGLVQDLRDNIVQLYACDTMILSELLAFFLPFRFKLGAHTQERICPMVMILGDTLTGKSTCYNRLLRLFGAGRYAAGDSKVTTAGLIGGFFGADGNKSFSWGLLPTSHRAIVGIDEWQKMGITEIGSLTNLISSGMAERTTAGSQHKTLCHVRIVVMCNPRVNKPLGAYQDPVRAAYEVQGSPQDVGRLEYLCIQYKPPEEIFSDPLLGCDPCEHKYVADLARYHLGWVWNLKPEQVIFEDSSDIFFRAAELSKRYGNHDLLLATSARFKLARVAAGFAALNFSRDANYNLYVRREHVDDAIAFFHRLYDKHILATAQNASSTAKPDAVVSTGAPLGILPDKMIRFFNKIPDPFWHRLQLLVSAQSGITQADLLQVFGGESAMRAFLDIAHFQTHMIRLDGRRYFANSPEFHSSVDSYIQMRRRVEEDRVEEVVFEYKMED